MNNPERLTEKLKDIAAAEQSGYRAAVMLQAVTELDTLTTRLREVEEALNESDDLLRCWAGELGDAAPRDLLVQLEVNEEALSTERTPT